MDHDRFVSDVDVPAGTLRLRNPKLDCYTIAFGLVACVPGLKTTKIIGNKDIGRGAVREGST